MGSIQPPVPFLFVNTNTNSKGRSHSKDFSSSINSHAQLWRTRQIRQENLRALRQNTSTARKILDAGSTTKEEMATRQPRMSPGLDTEKDLFDKFPSIRPIIGRGRAADPFDCTAMRVDSKAFQLIHFYLIFNHHQDASAYQSKNNIPRNPAASGPAVMVSSALSNELHMFSLLSYIATCGIIDAGRLGSTGYVRSSYFVQKALTGLQERLRLGSNDSVDLLYDAALLGGTAVHRNELDAAKAHRQATKVLVESLGGFHAVPPHLIGNTLGLDLYFSVSTMSQPVFNFTGQEYEAFKPPLTWRSHSSLEALGAASQNTTSVTGLDRHLRKFLQDLVRAGQVLECVLTHPESSINAFWVPWKCATMILSLLWTTGEREDSTWSGSAAHDANRVSHAADQHNYHLATYRLEISRMTLIMWAMWLGAIPLSRTGDNGIASNFRDFTRFIPKFDASLVLRYGAEEHRVLRTAIEEWNRTLHILAQQRIADEDWVFSRLSVVIRVLEVEGDVQLGAYMIELHSLGRRHAQGPRARPGAQQRAPTPTLLASPANGRLPHFTPASTIAPQDPQDARVRRGESLK